MIKRSLITVCTFIFLSGLFGSLLHTVFGGAAIHAACPFQEGEIAVCSMNALEHISVWQSNFLTTITPIVSVLVTIGLLYCAARIWCRTGIIAQKILLVSLWLSRLRVPQTLFFIRYLQALFARGILHPKLF